MNYLKHVNCALFLTLLHFIASAQPVGTPVGQMVFYVQDNVTNSDLDAAATLLNSAVVEYPGTGQNIALVDWYGPFTIGGQSINTIAEVASYIESDNNEPPVNQQVPEIDGGGENHTTNPTFDPERGEGNGNEESFPTNTLCYDNTPVTTTTLIDITMGIFDTGTEYVTAQQNGYVFENVSEINGPITDEHGHGSHVSTIIDENYHNHATSSSLSYVIGNPFNNQGNSTIAEILFDLEDALDFHTLDVVNLSFSYPGENSSVDPLKLLMESPEATNTLFVVAAGNDNQSLDNQITYFPAAFELTNVLTVGSYVCNSRDEVIMSTFSNYSSTHVDILAPGEDIISMDHKGDMIKMTGTSQSTAFVSAAAAIIGSKLPVFDPAQVKCIILTNVNQVQALSSSVVSSGTLDINKAITYMECNGNTTSFPGGRAEKEEDKFQAEFFPNPFKSNLNITLELNHDSVLKLQVYDINGMLIKEYNGEGTEGMNEFSINFEEIPMQNQYIVRILTSDSAVTKRLIRFE